MERESVDACAACGAAAQPKGGEALCRYAVPTLLERHRHAKPLHRDGLKFVLRGGGVGDLPWYCGACAVSDYQLARPPTFEQPLSR